MYCRGGGGGGIQLKMILGRVDEFLAFPIISSFETPSALCFGGTLALCRPTREFLIGIFLWFFELVFSSLPSARSRRLQLLLQLMNVKKKIKMRFYIFCFPGDSLACFIGFCGQEFHKKKDV